MVLKPLKPKPAQRLKVPEEESEFTGDEPTLLVKQQLIPKPASVSPNLSPKAPKMPIDSLIKPGLRASPLKASVEGNY